MVVQAALPAAFQALQLGAGGDSGVEEGMFDGRDATHWSSHLLMAGAVVGLITLIAGVALNHLVLAIQGGILVGTNAIGSYYIGKFGVFHAADQVIQALARKVHAYWKQNVEFQKLIGKTKAENQELKEAAAQIEGIMKERDVLQKEKDRYLKELAATEEKLTKLKQVTAPLVEAVDQFAGATGKLNETGNDFSKTIQSMVAATRELAKVRNELKSGTQDLDGCQKRFDHEYKEMEEVIKSLGRIFEKWPAKFKLMKKQNRELKQELTLLHESISKLEANNQQMAQLKKSLERVLNDR